MSWLDEYDDTSWYTPEVVSAGDQEFMDYMTGAAGDQEFMDFMTGAAGDQDFQDFMTKAAEADSGVQGFINSTVKALGDGAKDFLKKYLYNPETKQLNLAGLGTAATALYGMMGGNDVQTGGYNKPIPNLVATRAQVPYAADPNRRPGEAGRQYFTDTQYTAPADAAAAQTAATTQAQGIAAAMPQRPAQVNPYAGQFKAQWNPPAPTPSPAAAPASGVAQLMPVPKAESLNMATGGIADMAKGRYLAGKTDGMADEIPTSIDGKDPAALSHGEFVIPADVVSHLGNGNSEAGAEKLYAMMDKVRKARTGTTQQGKRINPDKFMPGGLAGYANGGEVKKFTTGDLVPTATPTAGPLSTTSTAPLGTSTSSSLSPWAGDYVTGYLGKGQALANQPFQTYQGPLTAGASDLQQQAFAGIGSLAGAGYAPQQYQGGTFNAQQAQQYMNPYISAALNPQLAEMKRQSDIARLDDAARLSKAGAFGGSRQAIMESEGRRNLLEKQGQAIGQGYQTAYDKAMGQFNTEQDRRLGAEKAGEASRQYSAEYGLKSLGELANLGAVQRGITGEGIAADKAQFEEQRDYPYKMVQYQKDLLQGLPITSAATTANTTGVSNISSQIQGLMGLYKTLAGLGQVPTTTTPQP